MSSWPRAVKTCASPRCAAARAKACPNVPVAPVISTGRTSGLRVDVHGECLDLAARGRSDPLRIRLVCPLRRDQAVLLLEGVGELRVAEPGQPPAVVERVE